VCKVLPSEWRASRSPPASTCENLLDPDRLASIVANGCDVNSVNDSASKIRGEGSPLTLHFDPVVQEGADFEPRSSAAPPPRRDEGWRSP